MSCGHEVGEDADVDDAHGVGKEASGGGAGGGGGVPIDLCCRGDQRGVAADGPAQQFLFRCKEVSNDSQMTCGILLP